MIIMDGGNTDGARELLDSLRGEDDLRIVFHEKNQGKEAADKTGFMHARGDLAAVQDADREYDPQDFRLLLQPILETQADVFYGSRADPISSSCPCGTTDCALCGAFCGIPTPRRGTTWQGRAR
jgi:glycosyltransferase involved in cell wall biosynthesis